MLQALRHLLETEAAPSQADGKVPLREVLKRDSLELWYQPKIALATKRLVGAEALARGRRPDGSIILPAAFLPGAKEADMLELTERVIMMALRDFEDCAVNGASVKFAVNVPVSALVKLPIVRMLRENKPPTNWPGLILEVTEDEIIHDLKIANHVAAELRALNCTLALDDFGAGYSSLARLRQLPFSELKIDRSYVSNCHEDKVNGGLCQTIVALARRFELTTVAEGIEKSEESEKLLSVGCDVGQGYLFAKPMPKSEFLAAVSRRLISPGSSSRAAPGKPSRAVGKTLNRGALAEK